MHVVLTLSLSTLNMHFPTGLSPERRYPTDKYLLKVNNKNTSLVSRMRSKPTEKTQERPWLRWFFDDEL